MIKIKFERNEPIRCLIFWNPQNQLILKVPSNWALLNRDGKSDIFVVYSFFLFIEFTGVTLVKKIIQVSGAQSHNTSRAHCIVCSPPQVKFLSVTIYLPYTLLRSPPLPIPSGGHHTVVSVHEFFLSFFLFLPSPSTPSLNLTTCLHIVKYTFPSLKWSFVLRRFLAP